MKTAAIIGAGIGGLATAIRLAAKGYQVDVFEKEAKPGGKLMEMHLDGFRFDMGPSLFTQPERVEELFELFGEDPSRYLPYQRLSLICRYFWPDGSRLDVPADPDVFAADAARILETDAEEILDYLDRAGRLYSRAGPVFLDRPFPSLDAFLSPAGKAIGKNPLLLDPLRSLHRLNRRSFRDPRLVQLFDRYATYNGSNPYRAPATLKMIAHLEHSLGAWFPVDGMYAIAMALNGLAIRHGVRFHYNTPVREVLLDADRQRVTGIRYQGMDRDYQVVVSDVDIHTFYRSGMIDVKPPMAGRGQSLSSSALIFYWGVEGVHEKLDLHNILFSGNYREEFRCLFKRKKLYFDPTVYLFVSSRLVPADAPPGHENWFVMVNAPENIGQDWDREISSARKMILIKIREMLGVNLTGKVICEHIEDPRTIEMRTGSWHGALYGNSSNSRMSAFSRHPNHRSRIQGLYFTGGSVHPGGGIPLCLASARIVANMIDP